MPKRANSTPQPCPAWGGRRCPAPPATVPESASGASPVPGSKNGQPPFTPAVHIRPAVEAADARMRISSAPAAACCGAEILPPPPPPPWRRPRSNRMGRIRSPARGAARVNGEPLAQHQGGRPARKAHRPAKRTGRAQSPRRPVAQPRPRYPSEDGRRTTAEFLLAVAARSGAR